MLNYAYTLLIPLLPLATFLVLGLFGRKYFSKSAGLIGTLSLLGSAAISLYTAWQYFFVEEKINGVFRDIIPYKFAWLEFMPGYSIDMGLALTPITVMMIVVVTFISLMVHVFSLGYMKGEERYATYFSFLSLFTFSMLGLVLSSNIFQIYIFWELVGVSSFLLIGYYFTKPSAVAASKKAFIVTRFADFGFLIGILVLGYHAETLDFATLITRLTTDTTQLAGISSATFMGVSVLTWALTLVFIGGAGKSAMFPLHIWLPDAMEGPTPVSALIHAATMVVAGVFLVARLFPIYAISAPEALDIVMYVGAFSAVIAAIIACTQTDIKRVLAFSTMSQIGYMMFALGLAGFGGEEGLGYTASMFHLFTHAFFKSLLFLGAGAVIHLVHANDMENMGGLRKYMPITHISFLIACLAIAGIPPFAGFFSKEEILLAAFQQNKMIYWTALLTAGLTAFYMFRLYFNIFWHKEAPEAAKHHHGEGSFAMKLPLIILAICSLIAGFFPIAKYITTDGAALATHMDLSFSILPITLALIGIVTAAYLYKQQNDRPAKIAAAFGGFYTLAKRKFLIDELYLFVTKKVLFNLIGRPAAWIDKNIVDGGVNGLASATAKTSSLIKGLQSGRVQSYAMYFFAGVIGLAALLIYLWK